MFPKGYFPDSYFPPAYFPKPRGRPSAEQLIMAIGYKATFAYRNWNLDEPVTLQKLSGTPGGSLVQTYAIGNAYRGIPNEKEQAPTGGSYQRLDVVWRLPIDQLNGVVPLPADTILDQDGTEYAVQWAKKIHLTQEYRCGAIDLSIYLPDLITVERPAYVRDSYKLDQPVWVPVYENVSARVQPEDLRPVLEAGVATEASVLNITLSQQVVIESNDRVVISGTYYNILEYSRGKLITDLPTLRVRSTN